MLSKFLMLSVVLAAIGCGNDYTVRRVEDSAQSTCTEPATYGQWNGRAIRAAAHVTVTWPSATEAAVFPFGTDPVFPFGVQTQCGDGIVLQSLTFSVSRDEGFVPPFVARNYGNVYGLLDGPTGQARALTSSPEVTPDGDELIWDFPSTLHDSTRDYIPAYIQEGESVEFSFTLLRANSMDGAYLERGTYVMYAFVDRWEDLATGQTIRFPSGPAYFTSWKFSVVK